MADDKEVQPATPFMQGYRRDRSVTGPLLGELITAIDTHAEMRVGQLLSNVIGEQDLFNLFDEDLLRLLKEFNRQ